jgi:hypothetical protein
LTIAGQRKNPPARTGGLVRLRELALSEHLRQLAYRSVMRDAGDAHRAYKQRAGLGNVLFLTNEIDSRQQSIG